MKLNYLTIILEFCILWRLYGGTAQAQSDVHMRIQVGGSAKTAVGVSGFQAPTGTHPLVQVSGTVRTDLVDCGLFATVELPDSLAALPGGLFEQWKVAGAKYLLLGVPDAMGRTVTTHLIDLGTALEATGGTYRVDMERPWYTAHVIVDDVIRHFTGMPGSMATEIAFIRRVGDGDELFVADSDGREERQVTYSKTMNLSPSWSPDGTKITYSSLFGYDWRIRMTDVNTSQSFELTPVSGFNSAPEWNPVQPGIIAFTSNRDGNSEVYTMRTTGSGLRRLTNHVLIDTSPTWSPDGSQIAYVSDRSGNPHVYVMNSDGTGSRRLTPLPKSYEDSPNWSPRGDRIAFVMSSDWGFDIVTASPVGDDIVILTFGQGSNENPCWSPDGLRILFASNRTGVKQLFIMNWDGTNQRPLMQNKNGFSPSWGPSVNGRDIRVNR